MLDYQVDCFQPTHSDDWVISLQFRDHYVLPSHIAFPLRLSYNNDEANGHLPINYAAKNRISTTKRKASDTCVLHFDFAFIGGHQVALETSCQVIDGAGRITQELTKNNSALPFHLAQQVSLETNYVRINKTRQWKAFFYDNFFVSNSNIVFQWQAWPRRYSTSFDLLEFSCQLTTPAQF